MDTWEQGKQEFREAVEAYRSAIEKEFSSTSEENAMTTECREKVIRLFGESPFGMRVSLLYITLRTMLCNPETVTNTLSYRDSDRLTSHLVNLGNQLVDAMEKL
jgi:hypothetical protein